MSGLGGGNSTPSVWASGPRRASGMSASRSYAPCLGGGLVSSVEKAMSGHSSRPQIMRSTEPRKNAFAIPEEVLYTSMGSNTFANHERYKSTTVGEIGGVGYTESGGERDELGKENVPRKNWKPRKVTAAEVRALMKKAEEDNPNEEKKRHSYRPAYATAAQREAKIRGHKFKSELDTDFPTFRNPLECPIDETLFTARNRELSERYARGEELGKNEETLAKRYAHEAQLKTRLEAAHGPGFADTSWVVETAYDEEAKVQDAAATAAQRVTYGRVPTDRALLSDDVRFFITDVRFSTNKTSFEPEFTLHGITAHTDCPRTVVSHVKSWRPYFYVSVPEGVVGDISDLIRQDVNRYLSDKYARIDIEDGAVHRRDDFVRVFSGKSWSTFTTSTRPSELLRLKNQVPVVSVELQTKILHTGWRPNREGKVYKVTYFHPDIRNDVRDAFRSIFRMKFRDFDPKTKTSVQTTGKVRERVPNAGEFMHFHEFNVGSVVRFLNDMGMNEETGKRTSDGLSSVQWVTVPLNRADIFRSVPYGHDVDAVDWPPHVISSPLGQHHVNFECAIEKKDLVIHRHDMSDLNSEFANVRTMVVDIECPCNVKGEMPLPERDGVNQISLITANMADMNKMDNRLVSVGSILPIADATLYECRDEAGLMRSFCDVIREVDPDMMVTYNGDNFDNPYLFARSEWLLAHGHSLYGAGCQEGMEKENPFEYVGRRRGRWSSGVFEHAFESNARGQSTAIKLDWTGRWSVDLLEIMKIEYKLTRYSLSSVAEHFLGDNKIDINHTQVRQMQHAGSHTRWRIGVYCIKDSQLPIRLMNNQKIIYTYFGLARVCGVTFDSLYINGQQAKVMSQLYRFANDKNVIISEKDPAVLLPDFYEGALVIPPFRGFYKNIVFTLDFASLYPSIMIAYNLCFTTLIQPHMLDEHVRLNESAEYQEQWAAWRAGGPRPTLIPRWHTETPKGHFFTKTYDGILPLILKKLWKGRKATKREMAKAEELGQWVMAAIFDGRQKAIKVSMNSIYGFTGTPTGKLPCIEISESVTAFGQKLIVDTWDYIEKEYHSRRVTRERLAAFYKDPVLRGRILRDFDTICREDYPEPSDEEKIKIVLAQDPDAMMTDAEREEKEKARKDREEKNDAIRRGLKRGKGKGKGKGTGKGVAVQGKKVMRVDHMIRGRTAATATLTPAQRARVISLWKDPVSLRVRYGDTDSVMVETFCSDKYEMLAGAIGYMCEVEVNKALFTDLESVEQELEKIYVRYNLINKKRYSGLLKEIGFSYKNKEDLDEAYEKLVAYAKETGVDDPFEALIRLSEEQNAEREEPLHYDEALMQAWEGFMQYPLRNPKVNETMCDIFAKKPKMKMPPDPDYRGDKLTSFDCKGLEVVRRDNFSYMRTVCWWTIYHFTVMNDVPGALDYVREAMRRLWNNEVPYAQLIYTKGYNKKASEYSAAGALTKDGKPLKPPTHVSFVERWNKRNPTDIIRPGTRVSYVLIDAGTGAALADSVEDPYYALWKGIPLNTPKYASLLIDALSRILVPVIGQEAVVSLFASGGSTARPNSQSEFARVNNKRKLDISVRPTVFDAKSLQEYYECDEGVVEKRRKLVKERLRREADAEDRVIGDDGYEEDVALRGDQARVSEVVSSLRKCNACGRILTEETSAKGVECCVVCVANAKRRLAQGDRTMGDSVLNAVRESWGRKQKVYERYQRDFEDFQHVWKTCVKCSHNNEQNPVTCGSTDCSVLINRFVKFQKLRETHIELSRVEKRPPPHIYECEYDYAQGARVTKKRRFDAEILVDGIVELEDACDKE